jgi:hypothetical protein
VSGYCECGGLAAAKGLIPICENPR